MKIFGTVSTLFFTSVKNILKKLLIYGICYHIKTLTFANVKSHKVTIMQFPIQSGDEELLKIGERDM
jgi:hypothetical protein